VALTQHRRIRVAGNSHRRCPTVARLLRRIGGWLELVVPAGIVPGGLLSAPYARRQLCIGRATLHVHGVTLLLSHELDHRCEGAGLAGWERCSRHAVAISRGGDATYQSFGDAPIVSASRGTGGRDVARSAIERFAGGRLDFRLLIRPWLVKCLPGLL
jgi:hypothetical protein